MTWFFWVSGSEYHYTSHGFTLLSAVLEAASGRDFPTLVTGLCKDLGLTATHLDDKDKIIYSRSKSVQC